MSTTSIRPNWRFKAYTQFTWCSQADGTKAFSCLVKDLKVLYSCQQNLFPRFTSGSDRTLFSLSRTDFDSV